MLDYEAVRRAYRSGPRRLPLDRVPTREERYAAYERALMEDCLKHGENPAARGIGEHGALIGGAGKPPRFIAAGMDPNSSLPGDLMPLAWFEHARARRVRRSPHGRQGALALLEALSGCHLAGVVDRPGGADFARMFKAASLTGTERYYMWELLGHLRPCEFTPLAGQAELSIHQIARAATLSRCRTGSFVNWLNQFAARPRRRTDRDGGPGAAARFRPAPTV